jgi:hypothetical protein
MLYLFKLIAHFTQLLRRQGLLPRRKNYSILPCGVCPIIRSRDSDARAKGSVLLAPSLAPCVMLRM